MVTKQIISEKLANSLCVPLFVTLDAGVVDGVTTGGIADDATADDAIGAGATDDGFTTTEDDAIGAGDGDAAAAVLFWAEQGEYTR